VHIGSNAAIDGARTVAGDIEIDDGAATRSLRSVAGDIRIGERVRIDGNVSTVAGDIHIGAGAHVSGRVTSIAGDVDLDGCRIGDRVRITKGSLHTSGATALPGGILVRHARSTDDDNIPTIDIGSGTDVARIEVEPDTEVDLRISRSARVGKITGATPTYY
jgi:UDP-3-O-[3-hydroxymyristoyl] glucosamine N-acyltransferase